MQRELMLFNGHLAGHSESSINTSADPIYTTRCDEQLVTVTLVNSQAGTTENSSQQPVAAENLFSLGAGREIKRCSQHSVILRSLWYLFIHLVITERLNSHIFSP